MCDASWNVLKLLDVLGGEASHLDTKLLQSLGQVDVNGSDDSAPSVESVEVVGLLEHRFRRASEASVEESP